MPDSEELNEILKEIKNINAPKEEKPKKPEVPLSFAKQEEEAPKKARTRVPQEKSLKERGTGSTPSRTEAAEQKPSVKKRLEYLKSVSEQTRTGPEKIKEKTR